MIDISYLEKNISFCYRAAQLGLKVCAAILTMSVLCNPDLNDPEIGHDFPDCKLLIFYRLGYVLFYRQYI